jgi:flagellar biosynthesis chaperone FliJ
LRGITPDEPVKLPFGMEASSKDIAEGVGDIGTGLAVSGGRQLFRGLSKLSKTAGAKSAAEEAIATLKTSIDDLKFQKATETAPLQARMEGLKPLEVAETSQMKQEATSRIRAIQESSNQLKDSLKSGIDNVKTIITERLPKLTGEAAEVMQTKLKAFFSAGSKAYGDKIDEIVNVLATQGKDKIKRSVLANIVRDTISESAESLITEGQGYDALQKLAEKYQTVSTQDPTTGLIQALPDISIKEVINDLKNVKRLVSSGAQSGASRFAADDIPIEIFRKNMGEFINELTDNAYKGLNNQYKEFLDILKTSNRVFKPYKGSLEAGQGAGLITRVIRKTAKKSDVDLLTALEKGTDLAPGVGRVEGEAKAFYTQARNRIAQQTRKLRNVTREQRTAIQQVSDSVAEGIAKRKDMTLKQKQALQSEIQSISDKITQEISEKKINIEEARAILSDAVKAEKYLKGLKIAGASALVAIPYLRQIFSIGSKVTAVPMGE